jgi:hypothetical protein
MGFSLSIRGVSEKEKAELDADGRRSDKARMKTRILQSFCKTPQRQGVGQASVDFSRLWLNFGGAQVKIDANGAFQTNLMGGQTPVHIADASGRLVCRKRSGGG